MNNVFTLIVTLFDMAWLIAALVFLFLIWRNSVIQHRKLEKTLIEVSLQDSDSAKKAVEVAQAALDMLKNTQK